MDEQIVEDMGKASAVVALTAMMGLAWDLWKIKGRTFQGSFSCFDI